jgi:hypothetical protein
LSLVLLIVQTILNLKQDDIGNLASDHEAANQNQARQFCFGDQDPGKYTYPYKEAWHVGYDGRYVNIPRNCDISKGYCHFNYN